MQEQDNSFSGGGLIGLILLIVIGFWVYNTWFKSDTWHGIYETSSTTWAQSNKFDSREECSAWLDAWKSNPTNYDAYNMECGKNCKEPTSATGAYVCEETF